MIVIISAQQQSLDSPVEYRFGRSPYFIKYDTESNDWQALSNPGANQSGGAGVAAAQFVVDQNADAVISGSFGPNSARVLQAAKIKMFGFGAEAATVKQSIDLLHRGKLLEAA